MRGWLRKILGLAPRRVRAELRFVDYSEGDRLVRTGEWTIAPEEDCNRAFGMVYLERLIDEPEVG